MVAAGDKGVSLREERLSRLYIPAFARLPGRALDRWPLAARPILPAVFAGGRLLRKTKGDSMRFKSFVAATAVTAIVAAFCAAPAFAQLQQAPVPSPVCAECHAGAQHTTMLTAHGANNDANGSACQTCHGDTTAHVKDPTKSKPMNALNTKTATAAEKSAVCLGCHAGQRQLENWSVAKHRKVDVSCVSCHRAHASSAPNALRWDPNITVWAEEGIASASYAIPNPYASTAGPLQETLCQKCHGSGGAR